MGLPTTKRNTDDLAGRIREGTAAAWPICLGYVPIGLAFGVLAQKIGLHPIEVGLMSLLVFAGSSQFIAVSMLGTGTGIFPIVVTTFTVNLRHVLMSSSLAVYLRHVKRTWLALFAYGVTDESFGINLAKYRDGNWDWRRALVVNHVSNGTWIGSTVVGSYAGQLIPPHSFGIDYALTAMFLCLVVLQMRSRLHFVTAFIAGSLAVIVSLITPGNIHVIIASVAAATAGVAIQRRLL
jgi:4-azaleucine resistance transporter AzlC